MTNLAYITWNIRGLNDYQKSRLVHAYLTRKSVDICLLQETHLTNSTNNRLRSNRWGQVYSATYSNYSGGVAILIKRGIPWTHIKTVTDPEGRYILALGTIYHKQYIIANTYGPNSVDPTFFQKVWHGIQSLGEAEVIWGGDHNTVLSVENDRVGASRTHHPQAAGVLRNIINEH